MFENIFVKFDLVFQNVWKWQPNIHSNFFVLEMTRHSEIDILYCQISCGDLSLGNQTSYLLLLRQLSVNKNMSSWFLTLTRGGCVYVNTSEPQFHTWATLLPRKTHVKIQCFDNTPAPCFHLKTPQSVSVGNNEKHFLHSHIPTVTQQQCQTRPSTVTVRRKS